MGVYVCVVCMGVYTYIYVQTDTADGGDSTFFLTQPHRLAARARNRRPETISRAIRGTLAVYRRREHGPTRRHSRKQQLSRFRYCCALERVQQRSPSHTILILLFHPPIRHARGDQEHSEMSGRPQHLLSISSPASCTAGTPPPPPTLLQARRRR